VSKPFEEKLEKLVGSACFGFDDGRFGIEVRLDFSVWWVNGTATQFGRGD